MHIDTLLSSITPNKVAENRWQCNNLLVDGDWAQGRTVYGGVSAGMLFHAVDLCLTHPRALRSFNTNFVGPLSVGAEFQIEVECLRHGRNMSQYLAKITQNGNICVCSQAVFGEERKSSVSVNNLPEHQMSLPKKGKFIPQIPKVTPKFLRHFELAFHEGQIPFSWSKKSHYHGWMRFKEAPAQPTNAHLITLIDSWPPAVLQMLKLPAVVSTVNWNIEFTHPYQPEQADSWLAYQVNTQFAEDGYGHTEATIWDSNNQVVALSRQLIAVFA